MATSEAALALQLTEQWYIACPSADLARRPVARTILGNPLVLFRNAQGAPAALLDRCAHRNMRLSAGRVASGAIECPYHGWMYADNGACVHVPSQLTAPNTRVPSFAARESDGYVWVYVGAAQPRSEPPLFPHSTDRGWTTFRMATRFAASAFSCLENFLDVPHTVYVHSGWFRSRAARDVRAVIRTDATGTSVEFDEEAERKSVVARLLFPRGAKLTHTDRFVMPTTSRVDYSFGPSRRFIITSQCTPVTEHETDVYTVITFRFGAIAPLVRLYFEPLSRKILRQDIDILAEQTRQIERFGGSHFTFVETDLLGPRILRHWREAVAGREVGKSMVEVNIRF